MPIRIMSDTQLPGGKIKGIVKKIPTGDEGIYQTIEEMRKLALRDSKSIEIREIAKKIIDEAGDNDLEKAIAVFNYVLDNVDYEFDHEQVLKRKNFFQDANDRENITKNNMNTEFLVAPRCLADTTKDKNCKVVNSGDCDDFAMLTCSICATPEINLDCALRIIDWKPDGKSGFTHVYAEIGLRKGRVKGLKESVWVPADQVIGEFGKEKEPENLQTFRAKSFIVYTRK